MLDKAALGKKYGCFKCSCKFYDLNREEPLCPRCGADQREDPNPDPREAFLEKFRRPVAAPAPPPPPVDDEEEADVDVDPDELTDDEFGDGEIIDADIGEEDFEIGDEEDIEDVPRGKDED